MDPQKEIERLKELERVGGYPLPLKNNSDGSLWIGVLVIAFGLLLVFGLLALAARPAPQADFYPTPIVTLPHQVTRPLLPTPTLAATWPRPAAEERLPTNTATAAPTDAPTATRVPTYTPYPTLAAAATYTPYPTWTAVPTHTPYPTWTAVPTATPTQTPTPTLQPTPTATPIPPAVHPQGPPERSGVDALFHLLLVINGALTAFITYIWASTRRYRRGAPPIYPTPLLLRRQKPVQITGAAPVSPVTPVQESPVAPVQGGAAPPQTITVALQPTDPIADEALLKELYDLWLSLPVEGKRGETRSYSNVCRLKWGDKNQTRMALVSRAIKWGMQQENGRTAGRQIQVNSRNGQRRLEV